MEQIYWYSFLGLGQGAGIRLRRRRSPTAEGTPFLLAQRAGLSPNRVAPFGSSPRMPPDALEEIYTIQTFRQNLDLYHFFLSLFFKRFQTPVGFHDLLPKMINAAVVMRQGHRNAQDPGTAP